MRIKKPWIEDTGRDDRPVSWRKLARAAHIKREQREEELLSAGLELPSKRMYQEGMTFGLVTLVRRDSYGSIYGGMLHQGRWIVQCQCGETNSRHVSQLRRGTPKDLTCGAFECRDLLIAMALDGRAEGVRLPIALDKSRKDGRGRPPRDDLIGDTFGRLVVRAWVDKRGWECICTACKGVQYVRYSNLLGAAGIAACGKRCQPDPEAVDSSAVA